MIRFVLRRLLTGVAVIWATATAAFLGLRVAPGDIVDSIIGEGPDTAEIRARIAGEWRLDRSGPVQYADFLWRAVRGDLGHSYLLNRPVADVVGENIRPTVSLALAAGSLGMLVALGLAVATRRSGARRVSSVVELVLVSTPPFLIGIVLLDLLSFRLGWFPVAAGEGGALVLPALTLALPVAALLAQTLRDGLDRALDEPFIVTARARGLGEGSVLVRHTLRHALLPAVTLTGWMFGALLGGAVIVEQVFGRPGVGTVTRQAVTTGDLPVVMAVVMCSAVGYVLCTLAADLAYVVIDPRLRDG